MADALPTIGFVSSAAWELWLEEYHATSAGIWMKIGKKGAAWPSITTTEALDGALCYGWIDGQKRPLDAEAYLQKYTPRRLKSLWSKVNQGKVAALIAAGRMRPAGQAAIELAQADGRWDAAYDPASSATVPPDFQAALEASPVAHTAFAGLNRTNRYAFLYRIQTARRAETRARRITQFIAMLETGETFY